MAENHSRLLVRSPQSLIWQGRPFRCAVGRSGVTIDKQEGDGATPAGIFPLRQIYYRADRLEMPRSDLPVTALGPSDGWCDDPSHTDYNHWVTLPHPASHESLWRDDGIYDVIVVIGYNDDPTRPGAGSAIFLHVARADYAGTEGCVALALSDLLDILAAAGPGTEIEILQD